jgi:hypothetical protein
MNNLLSFDIGIKNMAYCIFSVTDESLQCNAWNVLNLMPPTPTTASATTPACSSCKRKSKFKKGTTFFCEAHTKQAERDGDYVRPGKQWTPTAFRKHKLDPLLQLMRECKLDVADSPTKTVCLQRLQQWTELYVLEPTAPPKVQAKSANDADLIEVGRQLGEQLDAALGHLQIDHVIIENQISPLASRMRTLQGMLTQYFILRYPGAAIHYISSSNKLKEFATPVPTSVTTTAAQKYRQHKTDGVMHCVNVLRANPNIGFTAEMLLAHAKKDDLADCWMQAMWFLKHVLHRINWSAEDLKINCIVP